MATGGLIVVGPRRLETRHLRVGDLLPALVFAPLLTELVIQFR